MTKTEFIETITVLQKQHDLDVKHHKALCEIYGAEDVAMYDNTFLVNLLIKQLQKAFPVGDDGECEIERFIYTYDFGRHKDAKFKNAKELFDFLFFKNRPKTGKIDVRIPFMFPFATHKDSVPFNENYSWIIKQRNQNTHMLIEFCFAALLIPENIEIINEFYRKHNNLNKVAEVLSETVRRVKCYANTN